MNFESGKMCKPYDGSQTVTTKIDKAHIPVFVREN